MEFNDVYEKHKTLILSKVKILSRIHNIETSDLIQEANIAIYTGLKSYDEKKNNNFSNYILQKIDFALTNYVNDNESNAGRFTKVRIKKAKELYGKTDMSHKDKIKNISKKMKTGEKTIERYLSFENNKIDLTDIRCSHSLEDKWLNKINNEGMKNTIERIIDNDLHYNIIYNKFFLNKKHKELACIYDLSVKDVDKIVSTSIKKLRNDKYFREQYKGEK